MKRCVVSVLGIVVFLTRGYKSEAIMAFWASRKREKVQEEDQNVESLAAYVLAANLWQRMFWQRILWQRDLESCFGYAEPLATRI